MKKNSAFILAGSLFGFILIRSEVVSWFRIVEMFRFESFHMYGIIISAIVTGIIGIQLINVLKLTDSEGNQLQIEPRRLTLWKSYLFGGILFGLGWGLTGACPGPLFALVGSGHFVVLIPIFSALFGTYIYGKVKESLPH